MIKAIGQRHEQWSLWRGLAYAKGMLVSFMPSWYILELFYKRKLQLRKCPMTGLWERPWFIFFTDGHCRWCQHRAAGSGCYKEISEVNLGEQACNQHSSMVSMLAPVKSWFDFFNNGLLYGIETNHLLPKLYLVTVFNHSKRNSRQGCNW